MVVTGRGKLKGPPGEGPSAPNDEPKSMGERWAEARVGPERGRDRGAGGSDLPADDRLPRGARQRGAVPGSSSSARRRRAARR